jgi:hypothetical protein
MSEDFLRARIDSWIASWIHLSANAHGQAVVGRSESCGSTGKMLIVQVEIFGAGGSGASIQYRVVGPADLTGLSEFADLIAVDVEIAGSSSLDSMDDPDVLNEGIGEEEEGVEDMMETDAVRVVHLIADRVKNITWRDSTPMKAFLLMFTDMGE